MRLFGNDKEEELGKSKVEVDDRLDPEDEETEEDEDMDEEDDAEDEPEEEETPDPYEITLYCKNCEKTEEHEIDFGLLVEEYCKKEKCGKCGCKTLKKPDPDEEDE